MTYLMIYVLSCLLIHASAIPLKPRDVADPPITSPDANTVWTVGENVTVTWNTSSIPSSITNSQGKVVLGYLTSDSENLNINSPLASGFPITAGQVSFVVPSVPTGNNYIVALFGDSGNISPEFTIIGTSSSSSPTSAASSAASSSGLLALPSNSSSVSTPTDTESDSVTVVVTTEIVTSVAVVTVPGSTHYISSTGAGDPPSSSAPAQPTSTSEPVQSTATVISASDATSTADPPSSTDTPQTESGSTSDPASSSTVTTTSAAATSSTSTSDAWSWRESAGKQPVSAALVAAAAIFML